MPPDFISASFKDAKNGNKKLMGMVRLHIVFYSFGVVPIPVTPFTLAASANRGQGDARAGAYCNIPCSRHSDRGIQGSVSMIGGHAIPNFPCNPFHLQQNHW